MYSMLIRTTPRRYFGLTVNLKPKLRFNHDGKFKILQLTDLHLDVPNDINFTINSINSFIDWEIPDFIVFTGDLITAKFGKGFRTTIKILD